MEGEGGDVGGDVGGESTGGAEGAADNGVASWALPSEPKEPKEPKTEAKQDGDTATKEGGEKKEAEPKEPKEAASKADTRKSSESGSKPDDNGSGTDGGAKEADGNKKESQATKKLKVLGSEREFTQEQIERLASKAAGADGRLEQAVARERQAEAMAKEYSENPFKAIEARGGDAKAMAEQYLYNQYQNENMSPAEREQAQRNAEHAEYRRREQIGQQEQRQRQINQMKEQGRQKLLGDFKQALEGQRLPVNDQTISMMASYISAAQKNNMKGITAADVAPWIMQDIQAMVGHTYDTMPDSSFKALSHGRYADMSPEAFYKAIGEENAQKLREYDKERLGGGRRRAQRVAPGERSEPSDKPQQFINASQLRNSFFN
jgi:hypothetical protein